MVDKDKLNVVVTHNGETIKELGLHTKDGATKVGMSLGKTINTGNYESLRVDVEVSTHVNPEDLVEGYEAVSKMTKALFFKEIEAIGGK